MNKQFFTNISSKLSSNAKVFGKYLAKERMLPPQNAQRYLASGVVGIYTYNMLDYFTNVYPLNGKIIKIDDINSEELTTIKCFSSNAERIINNLSISIGAGTMAWIAPYIMTSLFIYHNINEYKQLLKKYDKYLRDHQYEEISKVEEK
jgi:hypothetical protein